jgi:hypothetical protein
MKTIISGVLMFLLVSSFLYNDVSVQKSTARLIQPGDLTYMGAFRLPDGVAGSEVRTWAWGGFAMTYYPDGDPGGPDDGYPGSIFGTGHAWEYQVSEITIPAPVFSASKNLNALNTASTLQTFRYIMDVSNREIPRVGLEYLPKQGSQTSDKLYFCFGEHMQAESGEMTHGWCELNLSNPQIKRGWYLNTSYYEYNTNDYMFEIPSDWASTNTPGKILATGRFRDGGWSGQGPALYAISPWTQGNPPPSGTHLQYVTLLKYTSTEDPESWNEATNHTMDDYHHSDEWSGAVWLTSGSKSAVVFVGTKGTGDCWYGDSNGPCYDCPGERGWWSTGFEGRFIFYDPDDLAKVASGTMEPWESQPYASLNVDQYLYHIESIQQWYHLGAACFDRTRGYLYVFEPYVDEDKPIIHVWKLTTTSPTLTLTVTSPNGGENWNTGSTHTITWSSIGTVGNVKIQYSTNNGTSWSTVTSSTANDGSYSWPVPGVSSNQCLVRISETDGSPSDISNSVFTINSGGGGPAEISLDRTQLNFGATTSGPSPGSQTFSIDNSGTGTMSWTISADASWLSCSPFLGTNAGVVTVSVNASGLAAGEYNGTITVSSANASNSPRTVTVTLDVYHSDLSDDPFGVFATPLHGSTVRSSIPVTGWALDDVGVESVKIYRQQGGSRLYIGDAVFVEGARPDVEQAYPDYPMNYRAGWGYMMLTNFLPNGGNGIFTIDAIAADKDGNQVTLGSKTIYCDNANAVKPFGAIDTPTQGGTASENSFVNWGWVLTPQPNDIPGSGSTINVYVNGVNLGHPTYNIYRKDIADLFPGYANTNGAAGYFYLDTTAYKNGVHTIQWTATDNSGNTDGIGSRYFTIQNTGNNSRGNSRGQGGLPPCFPPGSSSHEPIYLEKGYNKNIKPPRIDPDENGVINFRVKELERLEIHFTEGTRKLAPLPELTPFWRYTGYQLVNQQLKPLPPGSTFDPDKGIFFWQLGAGFVGEYLLVFLEKDQNSTISKRIVKITILPKY